VTKTGYTNNVLGALTLCYVLNTMDRSQTVQAIKKEFGASDSTKWSGTGAVRPRAAGGLPFSREALRRGERT
jgi:hypothetical protein